ncbi:NACHT domain-containing protein [Amycolatopsis alba]|nr:hypothetical protein [Amycolatopsis alba]
MANDYHLEELGPRAFEQLAVALAAATFGPGVEVYGSGKDGGREATIDGRIEWDAGETAWDGYTVIQAKQCENPRSPADNLLWLQGQIHRELNTWMDTTSKRERFPNYVLFISNVRLSASQGGGVDQIRDYAGREIKRNHALGKSDTPHSRGLRKIKVWHRDTLNALISGNQGVRAAFPALLTVGDLLTRLRTLPGIVDPETLTPVLRDHAVSTLRNDRWIRFGEAGGLQARQSVDRVVVDLPVQTGDGSSKRALDISLELGNAILRRSVWPADQPRHLVITGAAGNGKSTIARYLTQVYRARFLEGDTVTPAADVIMNETATSLERLHLSAPSSRRWPLNVSLPAMAKDMGPDGGPSMIRWLSQQVTNRASIEILPATLEKWLQAWPSVLFLDGFDEVTAPSLRQRVVDEIAELVDHADNLDADLFIVVTTRPTGYTERIMPAEFAQIDLDYFTISEAVAYGRHVTTQRLHDDVSMQEQVLERFDRAASAPATERLIKTPLQVLILTFILENLGDLPATRYELFWSYYDTVYKREQEKPTAHRSFLRGHRDDITELHERVGLLLHTHSENTDEPQARLPLTSLRQLAHDRMIEVGHDDIDEADDLADRIIDIATTRLVLLAADQDETVSFEVRSLQELMAARALVNGDDDTIFKNLTATAPSPHWRNTWLFAAGKLFTESDHRRTLVLDIVNGFDHSSNDWPGWLYPVGSELAAHLLDDGMAESKPTALKALVTIALRCLHGPMPKEFAAVAAGLSYAAKHKALHALIRNELRAAFAGSPTTAGVASMLMLESSGITMVPGQPSPSAVKRIAQIWQYTPPKGPTTKIGKLLRKPLSDLHDKPGAALLESVLDECDKLALFKMPDGSLWPAAVPASFDGRRLNTVLDDPDASTLLDLCLGDLDPLHWTARSLLAQAVSSARSRRPVNGELVVKYLH